MAPAPGQILRHARMIAALTDLDWLTRETPIARSPSGDFHFGDPLAEAAAALGNTVVVPLMQLGLIEARGADADAFLQGQLSNDVRKVTAELAQLTSYNSPKGRML